MYWRFYHCMAVILALFLRNENTPAKTLPNPLIHRKSSPPLYVEPTRQLLYNKPNMKQKGVKKWDSKIIFHLLRVDIQAWRAGFLQP